MTSQRNVRSSLIESLESRQLFSVAPTAAVHPISPAATTALSIRLDKAYKGTSTVGGKTYPASIVVDSYSAKSGHVDATVTVDINGKTRTATSVGKLSGRRVNWVLIDSVELKATFSTNGKTISGTVSTSTETGTFSLKLS